MEIQTTLGQISQEVQKLKFPLNTRIRLIVEEDKITKAVPKKSKWEKIIERVEARNYSPEVWEHINASRKEFRADEGV